MNFFFKRRNDINNNYIKHINSNYIKNILRKKFFFHLFTFKSYENLIVKLLVQLVLIYKCFWKYKYLIFSPMVRTNHTKDSKNSTWCRLA